MPRALLGALVGFSLGLTGAAMQGYLRNPLADPGVLGVSAAAALGAVVVFYAGLAGSFSLALPLGGIAGAGLAALAINGLAARGAGTLALILAAALEPGLGTVVVVIVLTYWSWYARIIRGEILSLKTRDYVAFARVAGVSTPRIFVRHLLPNIANTLLVLGSLQVGQVIIFEASLSFLGLGIQPPDVSMGSLIADGAKTATYAPWTFWFCAGLLIVTVRAVNLVGDALRDAFDPAAKRRG